MATAEFLSDMIWFPFPVQVDESEISPRDTTSAAYSWPTFQVTVLHRRLFQREAWCKPPIILWLRILIRQALDCELHHVRVDLKDDDLNGAVNP